MEQTVKMQTSSLTVIINEILNKVRKGALKGVVLENAAVVEERGNHVFGVPRHVHHLLYGGIKRKKQIILGVRSRAKYVLSLNLGFLHLLPTSYS